MSADKSLRENSNHVSNVMLSDAKHLGWWGVTPPHMLRRYAPQHDIRDMTGVLTHPLRERLGPPEVRLRLTEGMGVKV